MGGGGLQKWENSKGRLAGKKGQKKRAEWICSLNGIMEIIQKQCYGYGYHQMIHHKWHL